MIDSKFKNFIRQLKKSRKVDLSVSEKQNLRKAFLMKSGIRGHEKRAIKSPYIGWVSFFPSRKFQMVLASFLIIVLLGGGIVFASENSLPGDILYPIKTNVTEKVSRVLNAKNPEAKEKFEINLVEKRLKEAEELDSIKKLDNGQRDKVKKELINQTKRAEEIIKKNLDDDNADVIDIEKDKKENKKDDTEDAGGELEIIQDLKKDKEVTDKESSSERDDENRIKKDKQDDLGRVLEKHKNIINKLNFEKKED